jgi:tetratricopeptide (TPR) repeat protein
LLQQAIKLSPNDAAPYKDLIELYIKTGQYDKVTPLLDKYVSLTGDDVDAKVRLVKFLTFQAKDYDRAIMEGEKLLLTNPDQYTLHRWLAWAYAEKGDYQHSYDHSVMLFDEIGKKEGRATFPSDYEYWGRAALKLGKLDEAAHIYRKYLELEPSRSQEINGMLAKAYFDAKNYEQAIAYYKRKGEEKPLSVADDYYLGLAYYYADKNTEADSAFARVLAVTPDYANGHLMRARIGQEMDTTEVRLFLAKDHYENYITHALKDKEKNKKNIIDAADYLAFYWSQMQGDAAAKAFYSDELAMDFTKESWDKYCFSKAQEYYELVLSLDPTNENAIINLKLVKEGQR